MIFCDFTYLFIKMKLIWYISNAFVIVLVLLSHPQDSNLGTFGNQANLLNSTRSSQIGLQLLIIINVFLFFMLTIWLVASY